MTRQKIRSFVCNRSQYEHAIRLGFLGSGPHLDPDRGEYFLVMSTARDNEAWFNDWAAVQLKGEKT